MRTDLATMGVANPYSLAEITIGHRIDWSKIANPQAIIETALGMPWKQLVNPESGSILYAGLAFGSSGPKRLPAIELAADIERRLQAHQVFKPTSVPTQVSPLLQTLLNRSNDVAIQRLRLAVQLSLGTSGNSDTSELWVNEGTFFTNPPEAEAGDVVQGGLGDCYFISALDAVAWTYPATIRWFPLVDPDNATHLPSNPAGPGSIQFSPGNYHSKDIGQPHNPITNGPLWEGVTMSQLLPESSEEVPLYATSSRSGETWPGLYEKAFAIWRTGSGDRLDYKPIGGGDCGWATQVLVGRNWHLDWWYNEGLNAADVLERIRDHTLSGKAIHPMTAFTYAGESSLPNDGIARNYDRSDIVYNHCYALLGWQTLGEVDYIMLRNPWGHDFEATRSDRAPDGTFKGIRLNTNGVFGLPVEVFRRYFEGVEVVYP